MGFPIKNGHEGVVMIATGRQLGMEALAQSVIGHEAGNITNVHVVS